MSDMSERQMPSGYTLFWKPDEVGGRDYFSDEIGGGVHVWNTSLVDARTLEFALQNERELYLLEKVKEEIVKIGIAWSSNEPYTNEIFEAVLKLTERSTK